jgi:predicted RNA-binding protein
LEKETSSGEFEKFTMNLWGRILEELGSGNSNWSEGIWEEGSIIRNLARFWKFVEFRKLAELAEFIEFEELAELAKFKEFEEFRRELGELRGKSEGRLEEIE